MVAISGGRTMPVIDVNGYVLVGFNKDKLASEVGQ
jgi:hypothetical protein